MGKPRFLRISGAGWPSRQMVLQTEMGTQTRTSFVCPRERAFVWVCQIQELRGEEQEEQDDLVCAGAMCLSHDHERDRAPTF